jgi:hypothetical protein
MTYYIHDWYVAIQNQSFSQGELQPLIPTKTQTGKVKERNFMVGEVIFSWAVNVQWVTVIGQAV